MLFHREDITYVQQSEYGVTKSRNLAIELAGSDYVLFCDDDVVYEDGIASKVIDSMAGCDVCTFRVSSIDGGYTKAFKEYDFRHNRFSILSVGTIEIACNRLFLLNNRVTFPEELGAGSKYPSCDEPVFLSRVIANKGVVKYKPLTICSHPPVSSGSEISSKESLMSRVIAFKYIFGKRLYILFFLLFFLKNARRINIKIFFKVFFSSI